MNVEAIRDALIASAKSDVGSLTDRNGIGSVARRRQSTTADMQIMAGSMNSPIR